MKDNRLSTVNIVVDSGQLIRRKDVLNICVNKDIEGCVRCNSWILGNVADSELDSIVAVNAIDFVALDDKFDVLENWLKKIKKYGSINIGFTDVRLYFDYLRDCDDDELQNILLQNKDLKLLLTSGIVKKYLSKHKFSVSKVAVDKYFVNMRATRYE